MMIGIYIYLALSAVATVALAWMIHRAKAQERYCDCAQGRYECTCKGEE